MPNLNKTIWVSFSLIPCSKAIFWINVVLVQHLWKKKAIAIYHKTKFPAFLCIKTFSRSANDLKLATLKSYLIMSKIVKAWFELINQIEEITWHSLLNKLICRINWYSESIFNKNLFSKVEKDAIFNDINRKKSSYMYFWKLIMAFGTKIIFPERCLFY